MPCVSYRKGFGLTELALVAARERRRELVLVRFEVEVTHLPTHAGTEMARSQVGAEELSVGNTCVANHHLLHELFEDLGLDTLDPTPSVPVYTPL